MALDVILHDCMQISVMLPQPENEPLSPELLRCWDDVISAQQSMATLTEPLRTRRPVSYFQGSAEETMSCALQQERAKHCHCSMCRVTV